MLNARLFDYGIQDEESDLRAHVSVVAGIVYVFPTKPVLALCCSGKYTPKPAWQPGVATPTASGYVIPWRDIPYIVPVNARPAIERENFIETESTTVKGRKAVNVVAYLLRCGWFPLMGVVPKEPETLEMQHKGVDLLVSGDWKIQVKCDWHAGEGGTGNLYIQIAERNPRGLT